MIIEYYLNKLTDETKGKIEPIVKYIKSKYPKSTFDDNWGAKTKMPMYRLGENYVSIACMKKYITLHFSNYSVPKFIEENYPYCKSHVGCVNFSYTKELPYEYIFKAIDKTFEKELQ